jgi:hypothetical protein
MFMEEYLTYVLDRRLATLQLMRPVALPTYSALPQPEQALSSRYPAGDESSQRGEYVHHTTRTRTRPHTHHTQHTHHTPSERIFLPMFWQV